MNSAIFLEWNKVLTCIIIVLLTFISIQTLFKPAKKAKRRSGDSDEDFDGSDMSFNPTDSPAAPLPARERGGRRAATKKKTYKFSSDEDDDDDDFCW